MNSFMETHRALHAEKWYFARAIRKITIGIITDATTGIIVAVTSQPLPQSDTSSPPYVFLYPRIHIFYIWRVSLWQKTSGSENMLRCY